MTGRAGFSAACLAPLEETLLLPFRALYNQRRGRGIEGEETGTSTVRRLGTHGENL